MALALVAHCQHLESYERFTGFGPTEAPVYGTRARALSIGCQACQADYKEYASIDLASVIAILVRLEQLW